MILSVHLLLEHCHSCPSKSNAYSGGVESPLEKYRAFIELQDMYMQ